MKIVISFARNSILASVQLYAFARPTQTSCFEAEDVLGEIAGATCQAGPNNASSSIIGPSTDDSENNNSKVEIIDALEAMMVFTKYLRSDHPHPQCYYATDARNLS